MNLSIDITRTLSPGVRNLVAALEGPGRAELHEAMGTEVQQATVDYVRGIASTRHATAQKLGASPSNHLAQAAEKIAAPAALSADTSAATLTINHVGMIRALRDVTIRPRNAEYLAIPIHAIAYNRRPAQLWDQLGLFAAEGKIMMPRGKDEPPLALYVLKREVTQKQDRTLLPSDAELEAAAARGALGFVRMSLGTGGES